MPLLSFERANQWVPLDFMLKTDKMKLPLHEFSFVKATAPYAFYFVMQVDFLKFYAFFIIVIIATRLVHRSLGRFYQYKGNNERYYVENGSHI